MFRVLQRDGTSAVALRMRVRCRKARWGWGGAKARRLSVMTHNGKGGPAMAHHMEQDMIYTVPSGLHSYQRRDRGDFLVEGV